MPLRMFCCRWRTSSTTKNARGTEGKKKRFHSTCAIDGKNLIFSRFPRPVIRSHRKAFRSSGKNHTQPVCGEHKTNSISSLLPFESLVHVESSCFTMLRGGHQEENGKKEKVSCASDLFGEDGNKTARRRLSRRKSIKFLSSSELASITSSSEKRENWS